MTRVIFFDAAGTLFHLPRGVGSHYREVAARHGANLDEGRLNSAFRRAWKDAPRPADTCAPREDDDRGWWCTLVSRVMDECGAPELMQSRGFFDELWAEFEKPGVWSLYEETADVLRALRGHFRLGVISNFDSRLRRILPVLGIGDFFEDMVLSSEAGADKPSPHIFAEALRRFGVTAPEALHVGDEPEADWLGAGAAGMRVFELRRPENSLRDLAALL